MQRCENCYRYTVIAVSKQNCKTKKLRKKIKNSSIVSAAYSQTIKPSLPARWLAWRVFFPGLATMFLLFCFFTLDFCASQTAGIIVAKFVYYTFFPLHRSGFPLFLLAYLTFPPLCCLCAKKQTFNANL